MTVGGNFLIGFNEMLPEDVEFGPRVMTSKDVLELYRHQSTTYYTGVLNNILEQYSKLDPLLAEKLKDGDIVKGINTINEFLSSKTKTELLNLIRQRSVEDPTIRLTEELHYTSYVDKITLNQAIVDIYSILKDSKLFKKFVDVQETSLAEKLIKEKKANVLFTPADIANINKSSDVSGKVTEFTLIRRAIGIDEDAYSSFAKNHEIYASKKGLNPMLKKWL
jgi:hypothetical protein